MNANSPKNRPSRNLSPEAMDQFIEALATFIVDAPSPGERRH